MTTSLPHTHVRLRDLSELVAGIPYVLGFPPTDSLVLFTFRRCPILTLSTTIRVDLPKQEHVPLVAADLSAAAARNESVAAIAVVVGEDAAEHRELIQTLRKTLADNDILLTHASWVRKVVHGEQWQCYDDPLCTGAVPDPQTSALAAAIAVAGDTTYPDREAVAAHLAPDPEEALARRKKLLEAHRTGQPQPYGEQELEADLRTLGHALDMALSSYDPPALNDHQLVRLAMAMSQASIRDECLAIALTDEPEPTERLWTALVRSLPTPERAEPAVLLAVSAYLRGAGVLAALALKIALDSNPRHRTALLLDYALQMGMPPTRLKAMLRTCAVNNEEEQTTPPPPDDDPPWETTPESSNPTTTQAPKHRQAPERRKGSGHSPAPENLIVYPTNTAPNPPTTEDLTEQSTTFPGTPLLGNIPTKPISPTSLSSMTGDSMPSAVDGPGLETQRSAAESPSDDTDSTTEADQADDSPQPTATTKDEQRSDISAETTMVGGSAPPSRPAVPPPDDDSLEGFWSVTRRSAGGVSVGNAGSALEAELAAGFPTPDPAAESPAAALAADPAANAREVVRAPEHARRTRETDPIPTRPVPFDSSAASSTGASSDVLTAETGEPQIAPGALSQRAAIALGIPVRHGTVLNALTAFLPPPSTEPQLTEAEPTEPKLSDRPPTDPSEPG